MTEITASKEDFKQLQSAQGHIAERLTTFFNSEDFHHYKFVLNEFDIFTLFLTSAAWLRVGQGDEKYHAALIEFHKAHLVAMVDRIIAAQVDEVDDDKADTLMDMVQNIAETRLREYFSLMQKSTNKDAHLFFTELTDSFLEKFINYDDPQLLTLVVALVTELFHETLALFKHEGSPQ